MFGANPASFVWQRPDQLLFVYFASDQNILSRIDTCWGSTTLIFQFNISLRQLLVTFYYVTVPVIAGHRFNRPR